jgi:hypothetical protein
MAAAGDRPVQRQSCQRIDVSTSVFPGAWQVPSKPQCFGYLLWSIPGSAGGK